MNKYNMSLLASIITVGLTANAVAADSLVEFTAGTPAKAEEVNGNFAYLDSKIDAIKATTSLDIDCSSSPELLKTTLDAATYAGPLTLNVTGACNGPINIKKNDVIISGGEITGMEVDGELEAMFVSGRTNIKLVDVKINSGSVSIVRESYVRFENVTLPTPTLEDADDGWYAPNVSMRSSSLRINSGSLDNLSLANTFNSYVRLNSGLTGSPQQINIDLNSSLHSKVANLNIKGVLSLFGNGSFIGKKVSAGSFEMGNSSAFEASEYTSTGFVALNEGAVFAIENNDGVTTPLSVLAMECHAADIYVDGGVSFTGTHEEAGNTSFEAHHGCRGEISGQVTFQGTVDDWTKANYSHIMLSYKDANNQFQYRD
ncbi:hypothetical protein FCV43_10485 [Vibrio genomosp. F6]|uniref:hypothetical protein n=1 Tax=Vibrio genomosp. F6 TaxID=723172 RepID=UPI0010BE04E7|nr:hypothetical protein [Vibrio genomosp. F6]TKF21743.1 hypothetical protein FCV43_10485 [Vibrio genomosp. F6]